MGKHFHLIIEAPKLLPKQGMYFAEDEDSHEKGSSPQHHYFNSSHVGHGEVLFSN